MANEFLKGLESIDVKHHGVVAILRYNGIFYGIPLQNEDILKFEVAVCTENQTFQSGYLKTSKLGLIGGKIERGETPKEAIEREIISELAEPLNLSEVFVRSNILPHLCLNELREIDDFLVIQATQTSMDEECRPRGIFKIFVTYVDLDDYAYEQVSKILHPINENTLSEFRPYVSALFSKEENLLQLTQIDEIR
jgi:hypothetical protein